MVERERAKGGCLHRLLLVVALAAAIALGAFAWRTLQPQDLADLEEAATSRNLRQVLVNGREGGYEVVLSEAEVNAFIRRTLEARQGGWLADQAALRGVRVRLEDGLAEVIIERELFGRPHTLSLFLRLEQMQPEEGVVETRVHLDGGPLIEGWPVVVGGRFGRVRVPQGFLLLALESFAQLGEVYAPELAEIGLVREGGEIAGLVPRLAFEEGRLRVSPAEAFAAP